MYHVIVRGNQRQVIFRDDIDRTAYLDRVERYRQRYALTLYAYVFMANHVHLLLETHEAPLSKMMQGLQFTYTQYFNRRYHLSGHLFEGRYKAILCDRDVYLLELVRYLHLNPARLRRPLDPWRYRWSSHRTYLGEPSSVNVETAFVLDQFGRRLGQARRAYLRFMQEGLPLGHQARYYDAVDQRFLGDERFITEVDRRTAGQGNVQMKRPQVAFDALLGAIAGVYRVTPQELTRSGRRRTWSAARAQLVYLGREWSRMTTRELGRRLHRDPSMISRLYTQYASQRDMKGEKRLAGLVTQKVNTQA